MVFLKYKKDGHIDQFLMTIVGDKEYLEKRVDRLAENSYLSRDKHFSGSIFFQDLTGNFVNGWNYANGKVIRKCTPTGEKKSPLVLKKAVCMAVTVTLYSQFCTDWYTNGRYNYTTCENREVEDSFYYLSCAYEPSGGDDGEGGYGGGNPEPAPEPAPVPAIELSTKFENNEKVMCIYSNLVRTAIKSFNPLVTSFLANFSDGVTINPGDIKFDLGSLDGAYGNSTQSGDMFTVMLNENEISTRAPLEIAKTLIHEILHAQIGHNLQITPNSFVSNFRQYIETVNGVSDINDHQFMIANYVQPMMRFLKDYDSLNGYSASDDYYRSLALSGLEGIISTMEMNDLINAQNYFRNRGLNCQ